MLGLQVGASRRHRHRSFVLLSVATVCGIAYLLVGLALKMRLVDIVSLGLPLYYVSAILLVLQMTLGIWGTATLFQSYRELASSKGTIDPRNSSGA